MPPSYFNDAEAELQGYTSSSSFDPMNDSPFATLSRILGQMDDEELLDKLDELDIFRSELMGGIPPFPGRMPSRIDALLEKIQSHVNPSRPKQKQIEKKRGNRRKR